jgi:DNA-binding transcriptional ArsR family regulator
MSKGIIVLIIEQLFNSHFYLKLLGGEMKERKKRGRERVGVRAVPRERVRSAQRAGLQGPELTRLALIYQALGDPTRLKIIHALLAGEMCVSDLAFYLQRGESATSHQLRHLRNLSLVKARREGQMVYYSLDDRHVVPLIKTGLDLVRKK